MVILDWIRKWFKKEEDNEGLNPVKYEDINPDLELDLKVLVWKGSAAIVPILDVSCGEYYMAKKTCCDRPEYIVTEMCGNDFWTYNTEFEALLKLRNVVESSH